MSSQTAFASSGFTGLSVQSSKFTLATSPSSPTRTSRQPVTKKTRAPTAVLGTNQTTQFGTAVEKKYQVTVLGKTEDKNKVVEVDAETDLRAALLAKGVDVYTFGGKLRNCGGGGQCGTCLISVEDGVYSAGARTAREDFLLQGKPESWRLACRTMINGDITIRTKPQA